MSSTVGGSTGFTFPDGTTQSTAATTPTSVANLSGGAAGKIPYQSAADTTSFTAVGTSGQPLVSGGTGSPTFRPYTLPSSDGTNGQVLQTNGSGALSFATPVGANLQEFTSSGTWTKPSSAQFVMVELWGAGGGGGSGYSGGSGNSRQGGKGGAGGTYVQKIFLASALSSTETVTIGAGGTGGISISGDYGQPGTNGGDSTFGSLLTAWGGGLGGAGTGTLSFSGGGVGYGVFKNYPALLDSSNNNRYTTGFNRTQAGTNSSTDSSTGIWSGAAGGGVTASGPTAYSGGCSFNGGAGGGGGGSINAADTVGTTGGAGGVGALYNNTESPFGGGGAGGASAGANGTAGTAFTGGGGGSASDSGNGGTGGAGGIASGGGGGGAAFDSNGASGAGGAGGNGYCRVYSW